MYYLDTNMVLYKYAIWYIFFASDHTLIVDFGLNEKTRMLHGEVLPYRE